MSPRAGWDRRAGRWQVCRVVGGWRHRSGFQNQWGTLLKLLQDQMEELKITVWSTKCPWMRFKHECICSRVKTLCLLVYQMSTNPNILWTFAKTNLTSPDILQRFITTFCHWQSAASFVAPPRPHSRSLSKAEPRIWSQNKPSPWALDLAQSRRGQRYYWQPFSIFISFKSNSWRRSLQRPKATRQVGWSRACENPFRTTLNKRADVK